MTRILPGHLWIVSAPSGAGKTSLSRALVPHLAQLGVRSVVSVSYTTRARRPGECDGDHYHFVSAERFAAMVAADEFLEHAEVFGWRYGTGRAVTEQLRAQGFELLLDIDWQGARRIRAACPDAKSVFILPPSRAELERRLRERGQDSEQTIERRLRAAREEIGHCSEYDALMVNDDFARALNELAALVLSAQLCRDEQMIRHADLLREWTGR